MCKRMHPVKPTCYGKHDNTDNLCAICPISSECQNTKLNFDSLCETYTEDNDEPSV